MIEVTNLNAYNFEGAIRGMRNPLNSWEKSDSVFDMYGYDFVIEKNDLDLMVRLLKSGPEHAKFMRQIMVSMDITAPLYWWKEMDQYRIGCTTNSCSTMHTIHKKEFELSDFSHEHLFNKEKLNTIIRWLNDYRDIYINWDDNKPWFDDNEKPVTKKDIWWQLIQLLPSSFNQMRTWTGSYANLRNMYHQRANHKLDEWRDFCKQIESLPYAKELIVGENDG